MSISLLSFACDHVYCLVNLQDSVGCEMGSAKTFVNPKKWRLVWSRHGFCCARVDESKGSGSLCVAKVAHLIMRRFHMILLVGQNLTNVQR